MVLEAQAHMAHGYSSPAGILIVLITHNIKRFDQSDAAQSYLFLSDDESHAE